MEMGRRVMRRGLVALRFLAALVLFVLASLAHVHAAPAPISAEVTPMTLRPRTTGPAYLDIKLHCQSRSPLQGTLEIQGWSSTDLVCIQQISDLVLFAGTSNQRVMLPPPFRGRAVQEVRLRFTTSAATYDLGRFLTMGELTARRQYVIALCCPALGFGEPQNFTWRALRPERVLPEERSRGGEVASAPVWLTPEDLPPAIGLCAFDLLVLEGPALAALSEKQLADLATWVEAGGSLSLVAVRDLKPEHRAFLQRLALPEDDASNGNVSILRRAGLGRVALLPVSPTGEDQLMSEPWTTATYYLAHTDSANRSASVEAASRRGYNFSSGWYYEYGAFNEIEQHLLQALPRSARVIPLPILGAILLVFILLVGPGEWFVLGRLRRRVWTWATFPAIAIGSTFLTVRVAEHYLGMDDQHSAMVVTDYTPQGRAVRENRFDLSFAGRNKDAVSDLRQVLAVPCHQRSATRSSEGLRPPLYQGRVPTRYTLRQPIFQWTPYIQRTLSFTPATTAPRLSWETLREIPPHFSTDRIRTYKTDAAKFVAGKIGAQGWDVRVFQPWLSRQDVSSLLERLSVHPVDAWAFTQSPAGGATLSDLFLDYEPGDLLVVAERKVGQEIQIQRCVYHFDSHE